MVPSLFLAHGSPMIAVQDSEYTAFLSKLGQELKPKAIVIFTAHWESEVLTVSTTDDVYETIYDFGGFPPELYAVKYPARGSKAIAAKLEERFRNRGIEVRKDERRGLDHGSWTLLHRLFPRADIPVIQISVHPFLSPKAQYQIGEALQGIGSEDLLVIGSGVTVHNLRSLKWGQTAVDPWAQEFDDWLIGKVLRRDIESLDRYLTDAPHARQAVPRPEHFVPLFIAMGSGDPKGEPKVIYRGYEMGSISYLSFQF